MVHAAVPVVWASVPDASNPHCRNLTASKKHEAQGWGTSRLVSDFLVSHLRVYRSTPQTLVTSNWSSFKGGGMPRTMSSCRQEKTEHQNWETGHQNTEPSATPGPAATAASRTKSSCVMRRKARLMNQTSRSIFTSMKPCLRGDDSTAAVHASGTIHSSSQAKPLFRKCFQQHPQGRSTTHVVQHHEVDGGSAARQRSHPFPLLNFHGN